MLIPISDAIKAKLDVATITGAGLGFFDAIPWPSIAAFVAFLYTSLRIAELLYEWFKNRDKK